VEHEEDVEAQCVEVAAVEEVHPEVGVALVLEDVVAEVEEAFREVAVVALLHEAGVAVPPEEVDSEEVGVRSSVSWELAYGVWLPVYKNHRCYKWDISVQSYFILDHEVVYLTPLPSRLNFRIISRRPHAWYSIAVNSTSGCHSLCLCHNVMLGSQSSSEYEMLIFPPKRLRWKKCK
jgi:hypothetical protein